MRPLTVDDYLRLTDADDLYELIDGVLVERAMAAMWSHEQLIPIACSEFMNCPPPFMNCPPP